MSFQILNTNNEALTMSELDAEAAQLWGKEVHPKQYAYPAHPRLIDSFEAEIEEATLASANWFDVIGWRIHSPICAHSYDAWEDVRKNMILSLIEDDLKDEQTLLKSYNSAIKYLRPFFNLIELWQSKGYKPKRIKD